MTLEPGQRVRCVNNKGGFGDALDVGREYKITEVDCIGLVKVDAFSYHAFVPYRFKPIVRVKMGRAVA